MLHHPIPSHEHAHRHGTDDELPAARLREHHGPEAEPEDDCQHDERHHTLRIAAVAVRALPREHEQERQERADDHGDLVRVVELAAPAHAALGAVGAELPDPFADVVAARNAVLLAEPRALALAPVWNQLDVSLRARVGEVFVELDALPRLLPLMNGDDRDEQRAGEEERHHRAQTLELLQREHHEQHEDHAERQASPGGLQPGVDAEPDDADGVRPDEERREPP